MSCSLVSSDLHTELEFSKHSEFLLSPNNVSWKLFLVNRVDGSRKLFDYNIIIIIIQHYIPYDSRALITSTPLVV